jgi:Pentapeptide repeats (8 copies)
VIAPHDVTATRTTQIIIGAIIQQACSALSGRRARLDLRGADLREADLHGADLHGADLRGAYLREAYLRRADLSGTDLHWVDLHGADLHGADLHGAYLYGADLRWTDLSEADLRGAYLRWADLRWAVLSGADLRGAHLRGADLGGAKYDRPEAMPARDLRLAVAAQIEAHPEAHDQGTWGDPDPSCGTPCCVAGWACRLGGGAHGLTVPTAATLLLHVDGLPMPSFEDDAGREDILAALRET